MHLFMVVVDSGTGLIKESVLSEGLNSDNFILISETIETLELGQKWTWALENKNLRVNCGKTKMMIS